MPTFRLSEQAPDYVVGRIRAASKRDLRQVCELQERAYIEAVDPMGSVQDRIAWIRAWDLLCERKRIIRGMMKPGSVSKSLKDDVDTRRQRPVIDQARVVEAMVIEQPAPAPVQEQAQEPVIESPAA